MWCSVVCYGIMWFSDKNLFFVMECGKMWYGVTRVVVVVLIGVTLCIVVYLSVVWCTRM